MPDTPLAECGFNEPHGPHEYVVAENGRPRDLPCPGLTEAMLTVERLTTVLYDWMPDGADVSVGFDGDSAHLTGGDLARYIFDRAAEYEQGPTPQEQDDIDAMASGSFV